MRFAFTVPMIGVEDPGAGRRRRSLAQLERDAALNRVGRARRWVIIAAAALTAAFAALVSAIAPGRSFGAGAQNRGDARALKSVRTPARAATARFPPLASASDLGLQGPTQAPQSTPDPASAAAQAQASAPPAQAPVAQAPAPSQAPASSGGPAVVSGGS